VFCNIGKKLGAKRILDTAKRFGFYERPPLETPADERLASGLYRNGKLYYPKVDSNVDAGRMAFGQERMLVTALQNAMVEWPNGGMKFPKQDIRSPLDFEAMAQLVRPEDFEGRMLISSDPELHRREIQRFLDLGFDQVYLHNVGRNQLEWIDAFGREVLPRLTA